MANGTCCCCCSLRTGALTIAVISAIIGVGYILTGVQLINYDVCAVIAENDDFLDSVYDFVQYHDTYRDCMDMYGKYSQGVFVTWIAISSIYTISALMYVIGGIKNISWMMILFVIVKSIITAVIIVFAILLILGAVYTTDVVEELATVGFVIAGVILVVDLVSIYFLHVLRTFISEVRRQNAARTAPAMNVVTMIAAAPPVAYQSNVQASFQNPAFQGPPQTNGYGYNMGQIAPAAPPRPAPYGQGYPNVYTNYGMPGYPPSAPQQQMPRPFSQYR